MKEPTATDKALAKVAAVLVLLVVIVVAYSQACRSEERPKPTEYEAVKVPAAPDPAPVEQAASWDTVTKALAPADVEHGREMARRLVAFCGAHDMYGNTWSRVDRIDVDHHTIFDHGVEVMIWELQAHFQKGWKFDQLRDNVLWYFVDDAKGRFIPTKDVAGNVCGGQPRDQWSPFRG